MENSIQMSFRLDPASRDMAHALNINISEVCRQAIQREIGLQLEKNPNLLVSTKSTLEKYMDLLEWQREQQSKLMENVTIISDKIKKEHKELENMEKFEEIVWKLGSKISGIPEAEKKQIASYFHPFFHAGNPENIDRLEKILQKTINRDFQRRDLLLIFEKMYKDSYFQYRR